MSEIVRVLSEASGLFPSLVREIINRAPVSYKWYTIPKRNGSKRLIAQPAREVKALQRALVDHLKHLPIHSAATAYRPGLSIRDNALAHAAAGPIKKYDFSDFFPSIRSTDWRTYCHERKLFEAEEDVDLTTQLLFAKFVGRYPHRLAIGAPSSPWVSNVLMYEFDDRISRAVAEDHVTYSRYADDLTFSARRTGYLTGVDRTLRSVIRGLDSPKLTINDQKTVLVTKKYRRVITGLVLADDGRVTIGRDRKRELRAAIHHAQSGRLDAEEQAKLAGLLAHVKSVEPAYFNQLIARYGADLLKRLNSAQGTYFE